MSVYIILAIAVIVCRQFIELEEDPHILFNAFMAVLAAGATVLFLIGVLELCSLFM